MAWTSWRDGPAEVYLAGVDGERGRRLTYWSDQLARVCGWTPGGEVLALSASGQAFERQGWAYAVPVDGGAPQRLPFGPVADVALEESARALLNGSWGRDPAFWKRYRGGTAGRLWTSADGAPFQRILAGLAGQFASPMLVGDRLAFLSDHEGTGNVYSCRLDGSDLLRHTDHDGGYARQAGTDGRRVIYQCRGELWLLDNLAPDSEPRPLNVSLGSASTALAPRLISAADHLGDLSCDHTGLASVVEVRGTVHWLTHRDGPARALAVDPDVRARMPRVLGRDGLVVWVSDAGGVDGLEVSPGRGPGSARDGGLRGWPAPPCRRGAGPGQRAGRRPRRVHGRGRRPGRPAAGGGRRLGRGAAAGPVPGTGPCPGSPTRRTQPGWPGRTRARSRSAGSGSPGWPATRSST